MGEPWPALAGIPGAVVLLGVGAMYGKLVAGLHWGIWRIPLACVALACGASGLILLVVRALGDPLEVHWSAYLLGAVYLVAGAGALALGGSYARRASALTGRPCRPVWRRWPRLVPRVVLPALVVLTGVVILLTT